MIWGKLRPFSLLSFLLWKKMEEILEGNMIFIHIMIVALFVQLKVETLVYISSLQRDEIMHPDVVVH